MYMVVLVPRFHLSANYKLVAQNAKAFEVSALAF